MPIHNFNRLRGRLEQITIDSLALRDNLLGDPSSRCVTVYLPSGYNETDADYPLFLGLAGFTGSGEKLISWQAFGESLPQRIDRLVASETMGPVVLALPDCFTSLGGNQYIDSSATGRWEQFIVEELVPRLEAGFRVRRAPHSRAVFGKSSGGYGALVQGLRHGKQWGALACHSGDIDFDLVYRRELPRALDELSKHGGDVERFVAHLRDARKISGSEMHALMLLAMAATYDPDPRAPLGARLPVDPATCRLIDDRWSRWLEHDPLRLVERPDCQDNLRALRGIFVDCGSRDQYTLHYGARSFVSRLRAFEIEHRYEEFQDDHSGIDYRLDESLPFLYKAVTTR